MSLRRLLLSQCLGIFSGTSVWRLLSASLILNYLKKHKKYLKIFNYFIHIGMVDP
jgi:hypothetical protein